MKTALQHQAQNLAALLPPLLLEAERVAANVYQGLHGRRRAGIGESFWQFRQYAAGDDAARIDWRQSARGDRLYVREREWEAAQSAYLWADASGSMRWSSDRQFPSKAERAHVLLLAFASLLLRGGEKVAWLGREPLAAFGAGGLERIAASIDFSADGPSVPPLLPIPRYAHMVLASDFLMPSEILETCLERYSALHLRGALVHIMDPAEQSLPYEGRVEMMGLEEEAPLLLPNAGSLRDAYRERMAEHQARIMRLAESAGWFYIRHATGTPPAAALLQLFESFAQDHRGS